LRLKHQKSILTAGVLLIFLAFLAACTGQPTPTIPASITTASEPTQTIAPTATSIPTSTATPEPSSIYLSAPMPADLIQDPDLTGLSINSNPDSHLWFGPLEKAPNGDIRHTAHQIYALAAPFPTLRDDVRQADLQAFWQGDTTGISQSPSMLYIPHTIEGVLSDRWGAFDGTTVTVYDALPDTQTLWDENAWAILSFPDLNPKLKVISLDGISPLSNNFDADDYGLSFQYALVQNPTAPPIPEEAVQTLIEAIQPTNRDPEKMTSLVMTGVTALVRATAYKMEINGILYPGEEIVQWLSSADLTHISNEVSFYAGCPFPDPNNRMLFFCSNPDYIELLDYVGADIIELTGNHNNDAKYVYGQDVVPFTLDLYEQHGMAYFGGGMDLAEAKSPLLITHNGNDLAFIGCNAPGPDFAWATEAHGGAAPCGDYQWMADEINRLSAEGYLPIATFQYYEDYYNFAGEHHIRDFGRMAQAGAVIVNGSQAHRPKGMAFTDGSFIDYGLGNLFFDQMGILDPYGNPVPQTRWEIIQRHTFYDGRHLNTELLTAMLEDFAQPRPMTKNERLIFLEELFTASGWKSR